MKKPIPFGKYLLLERINVGGMAEVFMAKASTSGGFERLLAIKKILPTMVEDEEFITMFLDEARISVQLNHPCIVQIHELGKQDENFYIAMDYVAGKDLRTIVERYRRRTELMPTPMAVFVAMKMAEGLDYAHRKKDARGLDLNIVHRDVSPQNILCSYDGEVKIIDFGIAKAANRAQKTQAGILKGKFGYMSPEQVRGLPIDRRSDLFALGVVLFEMLTGEKLFVGESDFSTLEKVRNAEVPEPKQFNKNIPADLEKIIYKALAREVEDRYQWCSELAADLQQFLTSGDAVYGPEQLSQFMRDAFAEDLVREEQRLVQFGVKLEPKGGAANANVATNQADATATNNSTVRNAPKYDPDDNGTFDTLPPQTAKPKTGENGTSEPNSVPKRTTGAVPSVNASRGSMKVSPPSYNNSGTPRRTGTSPVPSLDPVAAAMAELGGSSSSNAVSVKPVVAKVPTPAPQPQPSNNPNNPYIPPPTAEELAEMGPSSDRTEIFRPAFDPDAEQNKQPVKPAPTNKRPSSPKVTVQPTPPSVHENESIPGESNATMIGPAPVIDENFQTVMNVQAPQIDPPTPAPVPPKRVSRSDIKVRPAQPPGEAEETRAAPEPSSPRRISSQNLKPLVDPDTLDEDEKTVGPAKVKVTVRPKGDPRNLPPPNVEPAEDEEDSTFKGQRGGRGGRPPQVEPAGEYDDPALGDDPGEEPGEDAGDGSEGHEERPPPKPGSNRLLLAGSAAVGVVVITLLGVVGMKMFAGKGSIKVLVDPPGAKATLIVDDKQAELDSTIELAPGPHVVTVKATGVPDQNQVVTVVKGPTVPLTIHLPSPPPETPTGNTAPTAPVADTGSTAPTAPTAPTGVAANDTPKTDTPKTDTPKVSTTFALNVVSDPEGAEITLNGKTQKSPATFSDLDKTKSFTIKASLKGYKSRTEKSVKWNKADDTQQLLMSLEKEPEKTEKSDKVAKNDSEKVEKVEKTEKADKADKADKTEKASSATYSVKGAKAYFVCMTKPVGKVYIDGVDTKRWTPLPMSKPLEVAAGHRKIKIADDAGHKLEFELDFKAGETQKLPNLDLE